MLANRQHVYGRNLRFCWFGTYHGILSDIACSINGNVKENTCPSTGSEELLDFQPLLAMKDAWFQGVVLTPWLIFFFRRSCSLFWLRPRHSIGETRQACAVVELCQPWLYLRLVVYGFLGLSEGA